MGDNQGLVRAVINASFSLFVSEIDDDGESKNHLLYVCDVKIIWLLPINCY